MNADKMGKAGVGTGVVVGGAIGWWACAGEGALIGSVGGPVGTVIGAVVGGIVGGLLGWGIGSAFDAAGR